MSTLAFQFSPLVSSSWDTHELPFVDLRILINFVTLDDKLCPLPERPSESTSRLIKDACSIETSDFDCTVTAVHPETATQTSANIDVEALTTAIPTDVASAVQVTMTRQLCT